MMKRVLILSAVLVAVGSNDLTDLRVKTQVSRAEVIKIFPTVPKDSKILDAVTEKYNSVIGLDKDIAKANTVIQYLKTYNASFKQMESILTDSLYNYVVLQLWTYCTVVVAKLAPKTQETGLTIEDLDTIKFNEGHNYNIINFLFNYGYDVDLLVHVTFFFQSVKFIQSNNEVKQIKFQVSYFKENLKSISKLDDPNVFDEKQYANYPNAEIRKKLRSIENELSDVAKKFASINSLTLITSNLIVDDPNKIKKVSDAIPVIKYILENESVDLIYKEVHGSKSQNSVITDWKTENILYSRKYLEDEYYKDVTVRSSSSTSTLSQIRSSEIQPSGTRSSGIRSSGTRSSGNRSGDPGPSTSSQVTSTSAEVTTVTLNALRDSIKKKNHYLNAVSYNNINGDVFLSHSMKDGQTMLGAVKFLFSFPCEKRQPTLYLTIHIVHQIRSQLLNFKYLYDDTKKFLLSKIPNVLKNNSLKDQVFLEKLNETLKLLNIPKEYTIDTVFSELCSPLMDTLKQFPNAVFGDDYNEKKFMNFYFYNTVLNAFEKFTYSIKMFKI